MLHSASLTSWQATFFSPHVYHKAHLCRESEWESDRQDSVVIRGVKVRCRDLVSASDCEANSFPQVQSPYHQTGRGKVLFLAITRSVLKKCRVHLHFRPELAKKAVLKRVVPSVRSSH